MCRDCKFFKLTGMVTGRCAAHPPKVVSNGTGDNFTKWPEVEAIDWCGEYQDRKTTPTPAEQVAP